MKRYLPILLAVLFVFSCKTATNPGDSTGDASHPAKYVGSWSCGLVTWTISADGAISSSGGGTGTWEVSGSQLIINWSGSSSATVVNISWTSETSFTATPTSGGMVMSFTKV